MSESGIDVAGARAYLRSHGWVEEASQIGYGTHFELWRARGGREVLVPLNEEGPDVERRWTDLVQDLSRYEQRSASQVVQDLRRVDQDIFEVAVLGDTESVAMDEARLIVADTREMFVVAGCSTMQRRAHHGRSRPKAARDLGRVVRLAHTRSSSFVFPFISPTTPSFLDAPEPETEEMLVRLDEHLFPRRALLTLTDALGELYDLTVESPRAPSDAQLQKAVVKTGLSGDLVTAVKEIAQSNSLEEVHMSVRWSLASQAPRPARTAPISFPREVTPLLEQTAQRLLRSDKASERIIFGYVSSLERDHGEPAGTVKVKAVIDKRERPISVVLQGRDYDVAARAHADDQRVVMQGSLNRPRGRSWSMEQVDYFDTESLLEV